MITDTALWQAINAYEIDAADAALPFSRRLARDNNWSHSFALAAIADYKRFIYLICTSGTVLTPSEEIDAVWHLHLLYTRDYWDRFCGEMLKRKIHHGPTKGGAAEAGTYLTGYQRTLTLYEEVFGPPPPALWPDAATRFSSPQRQSVDTSTHIILPKRQVFLCLTAGLPLLLAGCKLEEMHLPFKFEGGFVLYIFLLVCIVIFSVTSAKKQEKGKRNNNDSNGCGDSGFSSSNPSDHHSGHDSGHDSGGGDSGCSGSGCGSGCGGGATKRAVRAA
jgi:hypothetical protein